jgi:GNAT superfamily N-acetyltransferase
MTASTSIPARNNLLEAVEVGQAAIDEMSSVRHLHASSAKRLAAGMLSESEIAAFVDHIYTDGYSARISDVVAAGRLSTARLAGELIGSAGWLAANDSGAVARLIGVFVSPLYARHGIGRLLVAAAEAQARQAGFATFTVRAPLGASAFFEHLGYEAASHGVWPLTRDVALPVAFLRKPDPAPKVVQIRPVTH